MEPGGDAAAYARLAFRTLLFVGVPAWFVMRIGAEWIYTSKEKWADVPNEPDSLRVGYVTADLGGILLLVSVIWPGSAPAGLPDRRWLDDPARSAGVLALVVLALCLVALLGDDREARLGLLRLDEGRRECDLAWLSARLSPMNEQEAGTGRACVFHWRQEANMKMPGFAVLAVAALALGIAAADAAGAASSSAAPASGTNTSSGSRRGRTARRRCAAPSSSSSSAVTVETVSSPLGTIIVDQDGKTLYLFEADSMDERAAAGWPRPLAGGDGGRQGRDYWRRCPRRDDRDRNGFLPGDLCRTPLLVTLGQT